MGTRAGRTRASNNRAVRALATSIGLVAACASPDIEGAEQLDHLHDATEHCDLPPGESDAGLDFKALPPVISEREAEAVAQRAPKNNRGLPLWESRPGARVALFLDFDGGLYDGDERYSPASLDGDEDNFNTREQIAIIRAAMEVANTYSQFDVNVTTSDSARRKARQWAWILITNDSGSSGKAKVGAIGRPSHPLAIAGTDAVFSPPSAQRGYLLTHELGHNFGLNHSGLYDGNNFEEWSDLKSSRTGAWMGGRSSHFRDYSWMRLQTKYSKRWQDPVSIIGGIAGFASDGGGGGGGGGNGGGSTGGGSCHTERLNHSDYCTDDCPCDEGEGDCDSDSQCSGRLVCKQQSGTDFCVKDDGGSGGGGSNGGGSSNGGGGGGGDCHGVPLNDRNYCTSSCPCDEGEGDCDNDSQCSGNLTCLQQDGTDVCVRPQDGGDCHTGRQGSGSYCSDSCPCDEGEGDCDSDAQCADGLVCEQQAGTDFCVQPQDGGSGSSCNASVFNRSNGGSGYGECEGDCDSDADCQAGLTCVQLDTGDAVPGCSGRSSSNYDYCVSPMCM